MCHDIRAWKMMWHHHRHSRNWFWLQNSGHKNSCIWVNAGSISFNFDPTSICTISVFIFQNPREPLSPFISSIPLKFPLSHCRYAYAYLSTSLKIEALINVVASPLIFYILPTLLDSQLS
ncbi:hypothetical protein Hanom_Chr01g00008341 [Helianthus anomalus]